MPFFRNNCCTCAKPGDQLRVIITPGYCATEEYINCPLYERNTKEKQEGYPKQDSYPDKREKYES